MHIERGTFANGTIGGTGGDAGIDQDEWQAVGLGKYAKERLTENAYRAERGQLAGQAGGLASDKEAGVRRTNYVPQCEGGELTKDGKTGELSCPHHHH